MGSAELFRAYRGPAIFSRGFRPFFIGGALFAGIAMPLWSAMLAWGYELPTHLDMRAWHLHEMLFGYVTAIVAGFLLTAVPNWTGRLPVLGWRLAALWGVWIAGRLAMTFSSLAPVAAAVVDSLFLVLLAAVLFREIWTGKNQRNLPVVLVISLLALSNIGFHIATALEQDIAIYERAALGLIALLIALIGGRITPSFTRNWMAHQGMSRLPAAPDRFDRGVMVFGTITVAAWVILPGHFFTGLLFGVSGALFLARLARWRGWTTGREPMVLILHIGYLWLPVWFALMAAQILLPGWIDFASALHALSAGAIGTMTMAVATRVSLGHSGRPITATGPINAIIGLLIASAILRISANWLPFDYGASVATAGILWALAMLVFVLAFTPLLVRERRL